MTTYSYAQLEALWLAAGGSASSAPTAAAIATAESSGNPTAANPSSATGLWQVETSAHPQYTASQLLDPLENAKAAVAISNNGTNWSPWQTYTNGAYATYVNNSQAVVAKAQKAADAIKGASGVFEPSAPLIGGTAGKVAQIVGTAGLAGFAAFDALGAGASLAGGGAAGEEAGAGAATGGAGAGAAAGKVVAGSLAAVLAGGGIAALLAWLSANWLRILEFLGGVVLGIAGLVLLGRSAGFQSPVRV